MAHFASLDLNNVVIRVAVVNNAECVDSEGVEREGIGATFLMRLHGGTWKQCSYNGSIRKNFPGVGFTYDATRDAFIPPKPFDSWVLDESTCQWEAPVAMPTFDPATQTISWDEDNLQWLVE